MSGRAEAVGALQLFQPIFKDDDSNTVSPCPHSLTAVIHAPRVQVQLRAANKKLVSNVHGVATHGNGDSGDPGTVFKVSHTLPRRGGHAAMPHTDMERH